MLSDIEQRAVDEKVEQLRWVKDKVCTPQKLAEFITQRRLMWFRENRETLLQKYADLNLEEQAYHILFIEHMKIDPAYSIITRVSPTKIRIDSYNFCPYLIACQQLGLDTKKVCREIGEPSIQNMIQAINPQLRFERNYDNLRPNSNFCEEYIELT